MWKRNSPTKRGGPNTKASAWSLRSLGMGLDEKAIEAVRKYKFRPAMMDGGQPVPVAITVEVNFRLY
jgi:hypothetical protein